MRILIADDDKTSRQILGKALKKWGYEGSVKTIMKKQKKS